MCRPHLAADILGVQLVHDILDGDKIIHVRCPVQTVHIIVDGDKADVVLGEIAFGIISDLEILTSESRKILDDHGGDIAHFNIFQHLLKAGTAEIGAGETVIYVGLGVAEMIFTGISAEHFLLIRDGVTLLVVAAVVAAEAAIESGNSGELLLSIYVAVKFNCLKDISAEYYYAFVFNGITLLFWIFGVTKNVLMATAIRYAKTLIAAIDTL